MTTTYKIYPLDTGWQNAFLGSYFFMGKYADIRHDYPTLCFYVEGGGRKIMIDTGMCDSERAAKYHHPGRGQAPDMAVRPRLAKVGVTPEEIDLIIFTHLHWDHTSNMKMFSNARYVVGRKEYDFAQNPLPPYYRSYENDILGIEPPFKGCTFDFTHGEEEVIDGISVFPTPGHCPGHQSVTIHTAEGHITLAGDAILTFDNLKPDAERHMPFSPPARYTNIFEVWESLEKLVEPRRGLVLPSHDVRVLERKVYG